MKRLIIYGHLEALPSDNFIVRACSGNLGKSSLFITAGNTRPYHAGAKSDDVTLKTKVEILITNENLPRFSRPLFQANVLENATVGSTVLALSAEAATSAGLIYSLTTTRLPEFPFRVDHSTGRVTLTRGLNREARAQYVFSVNAKGVGAKELVEATVEINVTDVNDLAPLFGRTR